MSDERNGARHRVTFFLLERAYKLGLLQLAEGSIRLARSAVRAIQFELMAWHVERRGRDWTCNRCGTWSPPGTKHRCKP